MDNKYYFSEPFTRTQAWIDLLLLANHKESFFYIRGNKVVVKRGQVGYSKEVLADRWKWSRGKVLSYLNELEIEQQIEQQKTRLITLISISNYDQYQPIESADCTTDQTADRTTERQQTEQQKDTNKNDKNVNNEKNDKKEETIPPLPPKGEPEKIDFQKLVGIFNSMFKDLLPQVTLPLSDARKSYVRARVKEYGKEKIIEMFKIALQSPHLLGDNDRGWKASFDWLFKPTNFPKVIEGNYQKTKQPSTTQGNTRQGGISDEYKQSIIQRLQSANKKTEEY